MPVNLATEASTVQQPIIKYVPVGWEIFSPDDARSLRKRGKRDVGYNITGNNNK